MLLLAGEVDVGGIMSAEVLNRRAPGLAESGPDFSSGWHRGRPLNLRCFDLPSLDKASTPKLNFELISQRSQCPSHQTLHATLHAATNTPLNLAIPRPPLLPLHDSGSITTHGQLFTSHHPKRPSKIVRFDLALPPAFRRSIAPRSHNWFSPARHPSTTSHARSQTP